MQRAAECGMRSEIDFQHLGGQFCVPFGTLLGIRRAPKTVQTAFQEPPKLQRGSKHLSRGPKVVPKRLSGGAKRLPGGPTRLLGGTKRLPGGPKRLPGEPQEAPRGSLMPHMVANRVPRTPKIAPRGPQISKNMFRHLGDPLMVALPELAAKSWLLLTCPFKHSGLL